MEEKELTKQESLDLIMQMINQAKVNVKQSSFYLLLWGWIISISSFTHYYLGLYTSVEHPQLAWSITIPGIFISAIYGFIHGRKATIRTYADWLYFMIWMGFLVSIILVQIFFYSQGNLIGIMILIITGNAVFISGHVLKFSPLIWGGVLFWGASIVGHIVNDETILLITGVSVIFGYLVPGYMLKRKITDGSV